MGTKNRVRDKSNFAEMPATVESVLLTDVHPREGYARVHTKAKQQRLRASVSTLGLLQPIQINADGVIIDGHQRVIVARQLGWTRINAIRQEHLSDASEKVAALATNKLAMDSAFDSEVLVGEIAAIEKALPTLDYGITGFPTPELDTLRGAVAAKLLSDLVDEVPDLPETKPVSRLGDMLDCGGHRVLCGDARSLDAFAKLMAGERAQCIFADPPYNVPIDGNVAGRGQQRYREFEVASGELSPAEFTGFLEQTLGAGAHFLHDGGIAFVCMDHGHIGELLDAGSEVFEKRLSICVWDKGAGALGSLYRNAHELVVVFKKGRAAHLNHVALGKHGRNRTTVWRYPGIAQQGRGRAKALSLHPTVKPCALVAEALLDVTDRGQIVLDPFGGSGTTIIAAERTGRRARLLEVDPIYVDTIVKRFEALTQVSAVHVETGLTFDELREARSSAKTPRRRAVTRG